MLKRFHNQLLLNASQNFSGKFMVRVPPEVHKNFAIQAAESGVSNNVPQSTLNVALDTGLLFFCGLPRFARNDGSHAPCALPLYSSLRGAERRGSPGVWHRRLPLDYAHNFSS
ncbi:MAG: toxin-antitoxin system HicB family antitoxin [Desulfopila sp.]